MPSFRYLCQECQAVHDCMITKLTKGQQITLPKQVREKLRLLPGNRVEIELRKDEAVIRRIGSDLEDFFRKAKKMKARKNLSAEEMDKLIEDELH